MPRPNKKKVDYFSHDCKHGKTIKILERRYGNDGYAFWFKLLEFLGDTEGHCIDLNKDEDLIYLASKANLTDEKCEEILDLLAQLNAIDPELWEENLVWCDNFVDRLSRVYQKRETKIPEKPGSRGEKDVSDTKTPQSKGKNSKEDNKRKEKAKEIFDYWQDCEETITHRSNNSGHKKAIESRLKDGFEEDELKTTIDRLAKLYSGEIDTWLTTDWSCKEFFGRKSGGHVEKMIDSFPEHYKKNGNKGSDPESDALDRALNN